MRFDVYGRFQIEIVRHADAWVVYRLGGGTRSPLPDILIPSEVTECDVEGFVDDLLHEYAEPGRHLRRLD
jgi:hypothetical protein